MFHEQLSAEGKRWRDLTPPEARERVGKIAAVLALNYRDGLLRTDEQSRFTARVLGESLQDFVETLVTWMRGNMNLTRRWPNSNLVPAAARPRGKLIWALATGSRSGPD